MKTVKWQAFKEGQAKPRAQHPPTCAKDRWHTDEEDEPTPDSPEPNPTQPTGDKAKRRQATAVILYFLNVEGVSGAGELHALILWLERVGLADGVVFVGEHWLPDDGDKDVLSWRFLICGCPTGDHSGVACLIPPQLQKYVADYVLHSTRIIEVVIRALAGPFHIFGQHAPPASATKEKREQHFEE